MNKAGKDKMEQYIAPKVLTVNGKPGPCECREGIVCAYCVQANLVIWEKKEHPEMKAQERMIKAIKEMGNRKVATLIGLSHTIVNRWMKKKKIPQKYLGAILTGNGV